MKSRIEPKKVKIYDTVDANSLDVVIGQDDGVTCRITYTLSCISAPPTSGSVAPLNRSGGSKLLGQDSYLLKDAEYNSYAVAGNRLQHALEYVATKLGLTLIAG